MSAIPEYDNYIKVKTRYQRHELPDDAVVDSVCVVCQELRELVHILYSNSDLPKERREIMRTLTALQKDFEKI